IHKNACLAHMVCSNWFYAYLHAWERCLSSEAIDADFLLLKISLGATNRRQLATVMPPVSSRSCIPAPGYTTPYANASPYDAWSNINAARSIFLRDGYR